LPSRKYQESEVKQALIDSVGDKLDGVHEILAPPDDPLVQRSCTASCQNSVARITQPALRVDSGGRKVGEVDVATCEEMLRMQQMPDLPEFPKLYRGESYGSDQLDLVWEDKQVWVIINRFVM
jgi:hypothetical protein